MVIVSLFLAHFWNYRFGGYYCCLMPTYNVSWVTWLSSFPSVSGRTLNSDENNVCHVLAGCCYHMAHKDLVQDGNSLCHLGDLEDPLPCRHLPVHPKQEAKDNSQRFSLLNPMTWTGVAVLHVSLTAGGPLSKKGKSFSKAITSNDPITHKWSWFALGAFVIFIKQ